MKLFSLLFCAKVQHPPQEYSLRGQSSDTLQLSHSICIYGDTGFRERVKEYQKMHPDQVGRFKAKDEVCHAARDIESMKQNIKKSLRMMDNKGYLRQICFSLWPKYLSDRLCAIEYGEEGEEWKKALMREVDELESIFGFYIQSLYKNITKNPLFYPNLSACFRDTLDRISASEKWVPISARIQSLYRRSKYRIENAMLHPQENQPQEFKHQIDLLQRIYIQPHFSKKLQHIAELKPVITAYSRPRLIFSVCQYCIYKAKLAGYHEMLEFLEKVRVPDQNLKQFFKLLKAASIRTVLSFKDEDPFQYEYLTFDLSSTDAFSLHSLDHFVSTENNWNSLVSMTHLKPGMSINIKLNMKYNHFKIGVISDSDPPGQLRDYSQTQHSVCLCLMSSCIIKNKQRLKVQTIPKISQIQLNILDNRIQWKYSGSTVSTEIQFHDFLKLHIVMKKGAFQLLPLRRLQSSE